MQWRKILSLGMLDPRESVGVKQWGKFFDVVMLLVMFWLPIQWYAQSKGLVTEQFFNNSNWIIWVLFTVEALVMSLIAKYRWNYIQTNWLNLLIIILVFPPLWSAHSTYFAMLRYIRLIVLIRLIVPQLYNLHKILTRNHFGATLIALLTVTLLSGILMSYIDPQIGGPWAGIWWAWQTVTTVGYGDIVPTSFVGKFFASILMLIGVGLFSLVSANLAAYFVERGRIQKDKKPERQKQKQLRDISDRMIRLEESNKRLENLLLQVVEEKVVDEKVVEEKAVEEKQPEKIE